jgi:hypothetical protein
MFLASPAPNTNPSKECVLPKTFTGKETTETQFTGWLSSGAVGCMKKTFDTTDITIAKRMLRDFEKEVEGKTAVFSDMTFEQLCERRKDSIRAALCNFPLRNSSSRLKKTCLSDETHVLSAFAASFQGVSLK